MVDFSDKCIVLKVSDYRDNDKLAKVLTAANGLVTVLLRGVKKAKAKLKPFAQEFSVFDTRLTANHGMFLTPIEPMLIQDGFSLCTDLKVFTAASVASEATVLSICDDEPHTGLFVEMLRLFSVLQPDADPYYQASVYLLSLMELSGFYKEYKYSGDPQSPIQMLGYAQKTGYVKRPDSDMSRRALKYICSEFERYFETGLKSIDSIDLYN